MRIWEMLTKHCFANTHFTALILNAMYQEQKVLKKNVLEYNYLFSQYNLGSFLNTNLSAGLVQIELPEKEWDQSLWVLHALQE